MAEASIISALSSRITSLVSGQIKTISKWTSKVKNFSRNATNTLSLKLQEFVGTTLRKPESKKDYIRILGLYFSKQFLIFSAVAVCVGGPFLVSYIMPMLEGRLWYAKIRVDATKLQTFSGKVKIIMSDGTLIFRGKVDNGAPTGNGLHFDKQGNLIYKGEFSGGKYQGFGELYSEGKLVYTGEFKNNSYDGNGKFYNPVTGRILYEGGFEKGKKSGRGIEYDPETSVRKYFGEFLDDLRSGNGVEYTEDGENVYYEGAFEFGKYNGEGKIFSGRNLRFKGTFSNGLYEGNGTLYNPDTGTIIYTGEFKEGQYDGEGTLYDERSGALLHKGAFAKGKREGTGTSYDKLGGEKLTGKFYNDSIDYIGCLGNSMETLTNKFGNPTFKTDLGSRLVLAFTGNDFVAVMKVDNQNNEYICEKLLIGTQNDFMGISAKSTAEQRRKILGDAFTSTNFNVYTADTDETTANSGTSANKNYYVTALSNLGISITDVKKIPSDKYEIEGTSRYFIRLYFNQGKTELKFVEVCGIGA